MKKPKTEQITEFQENTLKYQNTMLAAQVDLLKQRLSQRSDSQNPVSRMLENLSRRIRIITAYNKQAIDKKCQNDELNLESFECICGAPQVEAVKYALIQDENQFVRATLQIDEPVEVHEEPQEIQIEEPVEIDFGKEVIDKLTEEKANLIQQVEEFKLQNKLVEEQFYATQLFANMMQLNNALTANVFHLEDQLKTSQLQQMEMLEKQQQQIQTLSEEYAVKLSSLLTPVEVINQEMQIENTSIVESLRTQILGLEKVIMDMKTEMQQQRNRNQELQNMYHEETQIKQQQQAQIQELKQMNQGLRILTTDERIDAIVLRYDKHKQLLLEIESEFVNQKPIEFINRFREFIGYVKMRDDKVKGLEQLIDTKSQDNSAIKKQMQSMYDELDFNAQVYATQIEQNKTLSKLLDETQKNESRAMKEKADERNRFELEKQQLLLKLQKSDELIKQLQQSVDNYKKLITQFELERTSHKENLRVALKQESAMKQTLVQRENDVMQKHGELRIFQDRERLSDAINTKYIRQAEKSKAKSKILKLQLKTDNKDRGNELLESMKMMVNCSQCKKRIKQVVLMKCVHMFCKTCIDDNQKNRNRACPVCRTRYGQEDVKGIKFN